MKKGIQFWVTFLFGTITSHYMVCQTLTSAQCLPSSGCSVALAYYNVSSSYDTLSKIADLFQTNVSSIQYYSLISDSSSVSLGQTLLIPFSCDCKGNHLGHSFLYTIKSEDKALINITTDTFQFLATDTMIQAANPLKDLTAIHASSELTIPVNCSCGDPSVSHLYGLFATYIADDNDNLVGMSKKFNISPDLLRNYNKDINFDILVPHVNIIFVPQKDGSGIYPPFKESPTGSATAIIGASIGGSLGLFIVIGLCVYYFRYFPHKKPRKVTNVQKAAAPLVHGQVSTEFSEIPRPYFEGKMNTNVSISRFSRGLNLAANKSAKFSYEEVAAATDNFSSAKKIGQGGHGSVYVGELRAQRMAIKKMDRKFSREFFAELKVLTHVHHRNLVQLLGYCHTADSLFLIYEYMENGTLSSHLEMSGREGNSTLSWAIRVKIALDAARGLEYIHEHTTPTYIHCDIKPSNILLDNDFCAKVADFGLAKLMESGNMSAAQLTSVAGTIGYLAPELQFGDLSPKADVYAFGVVLFGIISGKDAIVHVLETSSTSSAKGINLKGLVTLFEDVLDDTNGKEKVSNLVDPSLENNYPLNSVWKMAYLARACTRKKPMLRPNMRSIVAALMSLSSSTQDWDIGSFHEDHYAKRLMPDSGSV